MTLVEVPLAMAIIMATGKVMGTVMVMDTVMGMVMVLPMAMDIMEMTQRKRRARLLRDCSVNSKLCFLTYNSQ